MRRCGGCGKFVDHTISITDHPDYMDGDYCEDCTINMTAFSPVDGAAENEVDRYAQWSHAESYGRASRVRSGGKFGGSKAEHADGQG